MNTFPRLTFTAVAAALLLGLSACSGMSAQDKSTAVGAGVGAVGGAILTGGSAIFEDLGVKLENVKITDLGRAKKVKIDKDNTTIIEGQGSKDAIKARVASIQKELEKSTSDYDKEKLQERIAKLSGGVAKIKPS